jgi:alpha/beta superfamily hydrolase
MNNNVVLAVSSALVERSVVAFMFNFRGVGNSQGSYGDGIAEQKDVAAAINWLISQPAVDSNRLGLLGYSFGAAVALSVACIDDRVKAVALISLPPGSSQLSQLLKSCPKTKLLVCGTNDFVVPLDQAKLMSRKAADPKHFELIDGADHFWVGYEAVLADKVAAFLGDKLIS